VLGLQLLVVVTCDKGKHLMMINSKHLLISELYHIRNNYIHSFIYFCKISRWQTAPAKNNNITYRMSSKFFTCPVFRKSSKLSCLLYWLTECLIDCYTVLIALFNFNHWRLHYNNYLILKQASYLIKFKCIWSVWQKWPAGMVSLGVWESAA